MSVKRRLLTVAAMIAATAVSFLASAQERSRFDKKISPDQQILQALNRLTFGPRPGDVEEVRRMGVQKWIELQLHPDRIPENPALEAELKPLETLRMTAAEIIKQIPNVAAAVVQTRPAFLNELVSGEQMRKIQTGTAEERQSTLMSLDPEKRRKVLATIAPPLVESLPELKKEAEEARKMQQEERQKEQRRLNPPLTDLLNPDQVATAQRGNTEQLVELFSYLSSAKRELVAAALPPQALTELPEMRRLGLRRRQPQQLIGADMREGKVYRALDSNRQLEEVLVDFWLNHFNVYEAKNVMVQGSSYRALLPSYERDAIRPRVLGRFKDLLLATARHPAMLYYLDNWESLSPDALEGLQVGPFAQGLGGPGFPFANRQAHGINENYGRELMELHTLG